jgi:hypothetical protein
MHIKKNSEIIRRISTILSERILWIDDCIDKILYLLFSIGEINKCSFSFISIESCKVLNDSFLKLNTTISKPRISFNQTHSGCEKMFTFLTDLIKAFLHSFPNITIFFLKDGDTDNKQVANFAFTGKRVNDIDIIASLLELNFPRNHTQPFLKFSFVPTPQLSDKPIIKHSG